MISQAGRLSPFQGEVQPFQGPIVPATGLTGLVWRWSLAETASESGYRMLNALHPESAAADGQRLSALKEGIFREGSLRWLCRIATESCLTGFRRTRVRSP